MSQADDHDRKALLNRRADQALPYMSELTGRFGDPNRAKGAKWSCDQKAGEVWAWENLRTGRNAEVDARSKSLAIALRLR